jgi:hypothetical protein
MGRTIPITMMEKQKEKVKPAGTETDNKRSASPSSTDITAAYAHGDGEERGETPPPKATGTGAVVKDAVFGEINGESGPDFRSVSLFYFQTIGRDTAEIQTGWIMSGIIMIKTMMGLGVLSIPAVFDTLGLIPGIICLLAVAAISTWAAVQIQHFKINHPGIYGVDDAGEMMVGRIGKEILYVAFILGESLRLYLAFCMG